jgi:chemotaxis protein MotB
LSRVRHTTGRRRRKHEDHANHEAWAIPYADLLTLLLAFFVVMYAISSVNAGKYRVLSDSLFAAFRGAPRSMEPIQVGEKQTGSGADMRLTVERQAALDGKALSSLAPVPVSMGTKSGGNSVIDGKLPAQAATAAAALSRVADEVERAMDELVQKGMVTVRRSDFWIEVEMRTDILFPSGSAKLADSAVDIIQRLGGVLAPFPNPIRVEGHTDNKPIKTAVFYSNWELSAARAGSVVRVLSSHGVTPDRLAVIGYGEQRPMQTNATAEGRNANRRVVVVILSTELMRQTDPAELSAPTAGAALTDATTGTVGTVPPAASSPVGNPPGKLATPGEPAARAAPRNANGVTLSSGTKDGGSTAIASPADSPQALPVPTAAVIPTPAASARAAPRAVQPNTTLARNLHPE